MPASLQLPRYPWPWPLIRRVLSPGRARPDLFRDDAAACMLTHKVKLSVDGGEYIPKGGPLALVVNHYHRPGFWAWWLTIALSAIVPADIHWIITAELTYPDRARRWTLSPLSRWVLARAARKFGFTTMPAMPPRAGQEAERALAVRRVLAYVRHTPGAVIGLAPEGADSDAGRLGRPPAGAGRFLWHMAAAGLTLAPVGVFEADGSLCVCFGPHFCLEGNGASGPEERDQWASECVMRAIAALLPLDLRGEYAGRD